MGGGLYLKTLREQVYEYLRELMQYGKLKPGDFINMNQLSNELGISKTPLRDALIQLEAEGFVTFFPRRGVMVNLLTLQDIKDYYQIIGALEGAVILAEIDKITDEDIERMRELNRQMREAIDNDDFDLYYERNLEFHNVYLFLTENQKLLKTVLIYKQRLYDFPRRKGFVKEWEIESIKEHEKIIDFLAKRDAEGAAKFVRDVHWSFKVQERFIKQYYALEVRGQV
ncbi:MAG: GntR family transcriptional regulator [Synergistetes bacterium]|nr:GntR family transcriptional regulator [Synergistota bacterium]